MDIPGIDNMILKLYLEMFSNANYPTMRRHEYGIHKNKMRFF